MKRREEKCVGVLWRSFAGAIALFTLLLVMAGGTLAWLLTSTGPLSNLFTPARVSCELEETFDGTEKTDVYVRNTSNIDAFIRATYVVNWVDEDGNIRALAPTGDEYSIVLNESGWLLGAGGYYYHKTVVEPSNDTEVLVRSCTVKKEASPPEGYHLQVVILAEAIQADGKDSKGKSPAELVWRVTLDDNGAIIGQGGSAS